MLVFINELICGIIWMNFIVCYLENMKEVIRIINKIKKLFKSKWEEGFITQNQAKYLKVKGELVNYQI